MVKLILDRNEFTEIFGLDQLPGKQLEMLDLRSNPLEIDLEALLNSSHRPDGSSLRYIRVSVYQISWSLVRIRHRKRNDYYRFPLEFHRAVTSWFRSSILTHMMVGCTHFTRSENGLVFSECKKRRRATIINF